MIAHVGERLGDEIDLVTVVSRVVAGRRVRPARKEEVREPGGLDAEECRRTIRPVIFERHSVATADAHAVERAGAEVEAGGPHDDVELPHALGRLDPALGQTQHRRLLEIDE